MIGQDKAEWILDSDSARRCQVVDCVDIWAALHSLRSVQKGGLASLSTGRVASSSANSQASACSALSPHISSSGRSRTQTAGRSGRPYMRHRLSGVSWTQRTPPGLPWGILGMGEEIDKAIQHAPQPTRHSMGFYPENDYCAWTCILRMNAMEVYPDRGLYLGNGW